MLSRRHLRIKVLQSLYSFFQSGNTQLEPAEKQLIRSFDKLQELYIFQLSFLIEVVDFAENMMDMAMKKFFPTEEEKNPNRKFIENRFIAQLRENLEFKRQEGRYKVNWKEEEELIRKLWQSFKVSDEFAAYIASDANPYEADKDILKVFIREFMAPSESLRSNFEEKNIFWVDDFDTALMMLIKTLKAFKPSWTEVSPLPSMLKEDEGEDEFKAFIMPLFNKTVLNSKSYEELISENAEHWDLERIAVLDVIIIKMALCEMMNFPSIPVKVTINEYIEIAKEYSTPKSRIFVNGMLDKMLARLKKEEKIQKRGRGLLE